MEDVHIKTFLTPKHLTALIPAFFSFVFNLMIAATVDENSYANYILIIYWATFIGTISAWSFVDMSISEKLKASLPEDNLTLSLLSTFIICFIFFLFSKNLNFIGAFFSQNALIICGFALLFSWTRTFNLFWANEKKFKELFLSRISRSASLIVFGLFFIVFHRADYVEAIIFQIFSFFIGLSISLKYFKSLKINKAISSLSIEGLRTSSFRTLSLGVDVLHIPLCLLAMNSASALNSEQINIEVYIIGLGLPAISILTQILNEFLRGQLNIILDLFNRKHYYLNLFAFLLFSIVFSSWFYFLNFENIFYGAFILFIFGKLSSSFSGLLVYKLDYEKYDLLINAAITILIFILLLSKYEGSWFLVNIILATIASKYFLLLGIVFMKLSKLQHRDL